jgi:hypothetical protein
MKRTSLIILAVLVLVLLVSGYGQTPRSGTNKPVEVSAQTIGSQRAGTPYLIDLTRKGKTYMVATAVASRVRVRNARGESAMSDLVRKIGLSGSKFLIGTATDLRDVGFGFPPGRTRTGTGIKCTGYQCTCDDGSDCDKLAGACASGTGIVCGSTSCVG